MTGPTSAELYDWDDEYDDYDPDDYGRTKEEPDCYRCGDSGFVASRWWQRVDVRPCPSCNRPDWYDRLQGAVWRARHSMWRLLHPKQRDEVPF